jgi:uncharacterized protein YkwD
MEKKKTVSHTGENGSDMQDRCKAQGYNGWCMECAGQTATTEPKDPINMWMKSPRHRAAFMTKNKVMGGGRSGVYWTIIFADDASDAEDLICPDGKGSAYVSGKKGGGT